MPELPEVEIIAIGLRRVLLGRKFVDVEVLRGRSFQGSIEAILGRNIDEVKRKGKVIWIGLSGNRGLLIHLKMTGQLVWRKKKATVVGGHPTLDWINQLPSKHTRVILKTDDGACLFFNDLRVFGWIKSVDESEWVKLQKKLPPDVIDEDFSLGSFGSMASKTKKAIKLLVMDSDKIGGVGNIYANDALWLAKINPKRMANTLSGQELKRLYESMKEVIEKGISMGGASARNYVDTSGLGGSYQNHFLSYQQDGKPCGRCGTLIRKIKIGGRGTFWCEVCQK